MAPPPGATCPRPTRRLRLLAHHVHPHDAGFTAAGASAAEPAARMLRSAWSHNSIELSERPAPRGHRVLSDADHDFLATHGWLRVPNAVPPEAIQRAVADTWAYLGERWGMSPEDRESWYNEEHSNGHVKKYQSQGQVGQPAAPLCRTPRSPVTSRPLSVRLACDGAQWDIRQSPKVHGAFADLWGTEQLWCSVDSTHMNPPQREGYMPGIGALHIDVPIDVLLTDVTEDGGGFACVPGPRPHPKLASSAVPQLPSANRLPPCCGRVGGGAARVAASGHEDAGAAPGAEGGGLSGEDHRGQGRRPPDLGLLP